MAIILVVDNDQDVCQLISEILKEEGHTVDVAYNGCAGLEKIGKTPYDLVILDYKLPDIGGLNVLEEARGIRTALRAVMISAYGNAAIKSRAKELNAYAFLDKPFEMTTLASVVKEALALFNGADKAPCEGPGQYRA
ncbi:MAG: response regulator [Deltaproteobacteria bacterium]|nr:response regulator [Deltaproteobacteria bacterium]